MPEHTSIQQCEANRAEMKKEYYQGFEKLNNTLVDIKVELTTNNAKTWTVMKALDNHVTQQGKDFWNLYIIMWTVLTTAIWTIWTVLYYLLTNG